ncbi:MAG: DEAD/DEAH box helicase family protein [Solirubrobacterales bacterium]
MAIDIKFDANQGFQRDAIDAVVDLFDGQEAAEQGFGASQLVTADTLEGFQDLVFGNYLSLDESTLEKNLRRVQGRELLNGEGERVPAIPKNLRTDLSLSDHNRDFSVEMETGTGKTYVYLRTIAELHQKYGFAKFVIVVPSVAIREGVLSSLRLLNDHIREIYDGLQFDSYVWDSNHPNRVHTFATSAHLQIMVINIDSFTKDTNVINKADPDRLDGYAPIDYLKACRPVVVMDEPQNMETPIRQEAIRSLNPLLKLRYSATHKNLKHLVYRLTPVDAYDLKLVKKIAVLSIEKDDDLNEAHVDLKKINATAAGVGATAKIYKSTKQGTQLKEVKLHKDDDLYKLSGNRKVYKGWVVEEIHAPQDGRPGFVEFGNGTTVAEGDSTDDATEQQQRLMIREAVKSHFEKELQLAIQRSRGSIPARIKPLTLFFIDRVANYHPAEGKFRIWFEDEYEAIRKDGKYRVLDMPPLANVHDGYFAVDSKGMPKDTQFGRETKDSETAFERIMRNKEKLLSFEEPLRFIFSHSALVEGWDNPNVFTICSLQDGKSEMRKRQQIGRGLRLPVMENGERCHVPEINMLTVIALESFSKFAEGLQNEIEDETGVRFNDRIVDKKRDKVKIQLKSDVLEDPYFKALWAAVSPRTTYQLRFSSDSVVDEAVRRINKMEPLEPITFRVSKTHAEIDDDGVAAGDTRDRGEVSLEGARRMPDVVGELMSRVPLSRATIVRTLLEIKDLEQVRVNPSIFIDQVEHSMNQALYEQAAAGIVYSTNGSEHWHAALWVNQGQTETYVNPEFVVEVEKSVVDKIICDSAVEVEMASALEQHDAVPLFLKLPHWFKIDTPLGAYNPDWAFVYRSPSGDHEHYIVRETKGTDRIEDLQWESEGWKIRFGRAHFHAIKVDYDFGRDPEALIQPVGAAGT